MIQGYEVTLEETFQSTVLVDDFSDQADAEAAAVAQLDEVALNERKQDYADAVGADVDDVEVTIRPVTPSPTTAAPTSAAPTTAVAPTDAPPSTPPPSTPPPAMPPSPPIGGVITGGRGRRLGESGNNCNASYVAVTLEIVVRVRTQEQVELLEQATGLPDEVTNGDDDEIPVCDQPQVIATEPVIIVVPFGVRTDDDGGEKKIGGMSVGGFVALIVILGLCCCCFLFLLLFLLLKRRRKKEGKMHEAAVVSAGDLTVNLTQQGDSQARLLSSTAVEGAAAGAQKEDVQRLKADTSVMVEIDEPPPSSVLPPQASASWTRHKTDDGRLYFHNPDTGQTAWDVPATPSDAESSSAAAPSASIATHKVTRPAAGKYRVRHPPRTRYHHP